MDVRIFTGVIRGLLFRTYGRQQRAWKRVKCHQLNVMVAEVETVVGSVTEKGKGSLQGQQPQITPSVSAAQPLRNLINMCVCVCL